MLDHSCAWGVRALTWALAVPAAEHAGRVGGARGAHRLAAAADGRRAVRHRRRRGQDRHAAQRRGAQPAPTAPRKAPNP